MVNAETMNTAEKLVLQAQEREKQCELKKEELKQFKRCVNRLLSSRDGKYFWLMSRKIMKIDRVDQDYNPIRAIVDKAHRNYYNSVMQLLDIKVRIELEQATFNREEENV